MTLFDAINLSHMEMSPLAQRILERLTALKKKPTPASVEAGLSKSAIRNILEGKSTFPRGDTLSRLATVLGTTEAWLLKGDDVKTAATKIAAVVEQSAPKPEPSFFDYSDKMPVYASAEGGDGSLIIDTEPVDWVERPYTLEHAKKAYAIVIVGESMTPAYKPGDKAWVNPQLAPLGGDDCVLYSENHELGEERALIKEFVRATTTHWLVRQYNPAKELKLAKKEWQRIYKVVGKFNRG